MHRIYTASQAAFIDNYSIQNKNIPSLVLMERAALLVTERVIKYINSDFEKKVLCVCGAGNNGADAIAVARQLHEHGIQSEIMLALGEGKGQDFQIQLKAAKELGIPFKESPRINGYSCIVDGIFGNGLARDIEGDLYELIGVINTAPSYKISIDVPSGIDASTGQLLAAAVRADETVTFGAERLGLLLYPGAEYAGKIFYGNIGFAPDSSKGLKDGYFLLDDEELINIPKRIPNSYKTMYGRILIAAGSEFMGGAAVLSCGGAVRSGAGYVKVFTHEENRDVLLASVPEVIPVIYEDADDDDFPDVLKKLENESENADCIAVGPGISLDDIAEKILQTILDKAKGVVIADADALNLIASGRVKYDKKKINAEEIIFTPHVGEAARLLGLSDSSSINKDIISAAKKISKKYGCITILKSAHTVITDSKNIYLNTSGNAGMAAAGSGDVLTGILAGLSGIGLRGVALACTGVYLHGKAGDKAAFKKSMHGMCASDIVKCIPDVLKFTENLK